MGQGKITVSSRVLPQVCQRGHRTCPTSTLPRDPQEAGSQDPLHVTPRGRDPCHVMGVGVRSPALVTGGRGTRSLVARPGPAPSSLALSTPGSGARRSHDLWGRGCRREGAGGARAQRQQRRRKRGGGGGGPPGPVRALPSLPVQTCGGAGKTERRPGTWAPPPSQGFHLRPGVCGEGNPINNIPPSALPPPFPHPLAQAYLKNVRVP